MNQLDIALALIEARYAATVSGSVITIEFRRGWHCVMRSWPDQLRAHSITVGRKRALINAKALAAEIRALDARALKNCATENQPMKKAA